MRRLGMIRGVGCAALLVCGAGVGVAQNTAAPDAQTASDQVPIFRTNSNLVLLDVVVRDHGKPVQGLTQSEFHLFEDGKPQQVTIFEEHKATDALEVAKAPVLPPHFYSNDPRYVLTSAANVVLLDALNTPFTDQVYVRRRMLAYLKTIPPGTRVAVFTLASRLRMVEGFNAEPGSLEKALQESKANPEVSPLMDPAADQAMTDLTNMQMSGDASSTAVAAMQQFQQDQQQFQYEMRIRMTIEAMDQLGRYLSTIPGRKNLIWFSGAFPAIVMGGGQLGQVTMDLDFTEQVKKMNALLALARVAVYPVDARGLQGSSMDMAEANPTNPQLFNSIRTGPGGAGVGGQSTLSQSVDASNAQFLVMNQQEHWVMQMIANGTGGVAYFNTNGVGEALGEAIANGSNYYTLGYTPQNRNYDGSYRAVEVRLEDTHDDLEYRRGYYALNDVKHPLMQGKVNPLIAAMQRGAPELSQVRFDVRVVPADDAAVKGQAPAAGPAGAMAARLNHPRRYMVDYWIRPKDLAAAQLPDGRSAVKVELTQVDFNREGIRQNYTDAGMEVDLSPEHAASAAQDGIRLHQEIDLPEGQNWLRIGVADMTSGQIGTVEVPLVVQPVAGGR
ncbi:MAG: VWA domain-containing protein [Acidobacteriaceae bacterium]